LVEPDEQYPVSHVAVHCHPLRRAAPAVAHAESDEYAPFVGAAGDKQDDDDAVSVLFSNETPVSA
jgi:hypothetical protein